MTAFPTRQPPGCSGDAEKFAPCFSCAVNPAVRLAHSHALEILVLEPRYLSVNLGCEQGHHAHIQDACLLSSLPRSFITIKACTGRGQN